jgi:hypothetical protein
MAAVGERLYLTAGQWDDTNGNFRMRVTRDGAIIPGTETEGETFYIYEIDGADAGTTLRGQVSAQDSGGLWSLFVNSNPVEVDGTDVWLWEDGTPMAWEDGTLITLEN